MRRFLAFTLLFPLLFHGACSDTEEGTNQPEQDAGATPSWVSTECHDCYATRCESELDDCIGDPTCAAASECLDACAPTSNDHPDPACVAMCFSNVSSTDVQDCLLEAQNVCVPCGGETDAGACEPELLCQECGASSDTDSCHKCQAERCCDSDQACRDDQGCLDYFNCFQQCAGNYSECVAECDAAAGAENFIKFQTKVTCILSLCPAECGEPPSACLSCLKDHCSAEDVACQTDDQCARLSVCSAACGTNSTPCLDACLADHMAGAEKYLAFGDCEQIHCNTECTTSAD
ncbi:MAG: hypothetical protein KC766_36470 [Myxococcales bacterium]|nr:hypothetical protein [Myxococcales bacterium]